MREITKRSFITLLGGAVIAPFIPSALAPIKIPVEFGWTWFIPKDKLPVGELGKLLQTTLATNTQAIFNNTITNDIALKLPDQEQTYRLDIERITPEMQNERMKERLHIRLIKKEADRLTELKKYNNLRDEDYKKVEVRSQKALNNQPLYENIDMAKETIRLEHKKQITERDELLPWYGSYENVWEKYNV